MDPVKRGHGSLSRQPTDMLIYPSELKNCSRMDTFGKWEYSGRIDVRNENPGLRMESYLQILEASNPPTITKLLQNVEARAPFPPVFLCVCYNYCSVQ